MTGKDITTKHSAEAERAADLGARLEALAARVPEGGDDGTLAILEQVAGATSLDQLDAAWNANGLGDYVDRLIGITSIKRVPSDIADGAPFYLVGAGWVEATGEAVSFTTSAIAIMVQLIVAHNADLLPALFVPRMATKPTKNGYYPMHLEVYRGPEQTDKLGAGSARTIDGKVQEQTLRSSAQARTGHGQNPDVAARADELHKDQVAF